MGIGEELEKLDELRRRGSLTLEEFSQAKAQLLAAPTVTANVQTNAFVEEQLVAVRQQNDLARIDREWDIERRQYERVGRYGSRWTPTVGSGVMTIVLGVIFGLFWMSITSLLAPLTPAAVMEQGFIISLIPMIGIFVMIMSIAQGLYYCVLAKNFQVAFRAYRERRQQVADRQV